MEYNFEESLKRYNAMVRLYKDGATYNEIGQMFGITRQAIYYRLKKGRPNDRMLRAGILAKNGFAGLKGRERARMMVRIRDSFTCQDCGAVRIPESVQRNNRRKKTLKGRTKLFDVHHIKGLCGKKSTGYDSTVDLSGMITLCHKCHYNRPEHTDRKKQGLPPAREV